MSQPSDCGPATDRTDQVGKIGNCSPPEEHRFKKGVSGNPKGRPRKKDADASGPPSELADLMWRQAVRQISVTENGQVRTVTVVEGIFRVMESKALKGNVHAARLVLEHVKSVEQGRRREHERRYERQVRYKWRATDEIRRCEANGLVPPDLVPHPNDMQVDCTRELVNINGPTDDAQGAEWNEHDCTRELANIDGPTDDAQGAEWDEREAERQEIIEAIADLRKVLTGPDEGLELYGGSRSLVWELIGETKEELAALDANYAANEQRRDPGRIDKPHCNEQDSDGDGQVIRRTTGGRLKASKEALTRVNDQLLSYTDLLETFATGLTDDVAQSDWDESETTRLAIQRSIRYFRKVLTGSDEVLASAGWSRETVSGYLEQAKEELATLNAFYPPPKQRRHPDFDLKQWRKQKGKGREPPLLH